jgi:hypothetical protein
VRDFAYVPDAQVGWIPFAAGAALRAVRMSASRPVLLSSSVPYSAHFAAMAASRRSGAAWVAELRDPWSTSTSPYRSARSLRRRIDHRLEWSVVRRADHVVVTSGGTRDELLAAHPGLPAARVTVITNGFEPMPEGRPPGATEPMTILYAGTVAPGEDMAPVLAELDLVQARDPGSFRLRVLGPAEPWRSERERTWLALDGVVSPARAREALASSSALLLVQRHPAYRTVIPGKLFEYVGARRPVLAVCPPGSEMESLLRAYGDVRAIDPDRLGEFPAAVAGLLAEHRAGTLQRPRVDASVVAPLRRSEQAKQLAAVLDSVAR